MGDATIIAHWSRIVTQNDGWDPYFRATPVRLAAYGTRFVSRSPAQNDPRKPRSGPLVRVFGCAATYIQQRARNRAVRLPSAYPKEQGVSQSKLTP